MDILMSAVRSERPASRLAGMCLLELCRFLALKDASYGPLQGELIEMLMHAVYTVSAETRELVLKVGFLV